MLSIDLSQQIKDPKKLLSSDSILDAKTPELQLLIFFSNIALNVVGGRPTIEVSL